MSDSTRAVLDSLPDGVLAERGGFIIYSNTAARRALGYKSESELFWMATEDLIHPSERLQTRAALDTLRPLGNGATGATVLELRMLRRTGELVPVELRLVNGELDGERAHMIILRDLSERRRMEKQLQLADRMASLGTLSAGVAHEINNPLTYILANLELLGDLVADTERLSEPEVAREMAELLEETRDGALRVQTVVRDLKSFARAPSEQQSSNVVLPRIIEAVSRMAMAEIKHRAELIMELADTPKVRVNPNQLHQVLLNLLVNAAQSIKAGRVKANQIRITTGINASGDVLVEIADTGCGIEPAAVERIFDPFYTTKDQGEGSGLGLWICHNMIGQLGGSIAVDSIVGRGTTFRVTLPAATE